MLRIQKIKNIYMSFTFLLITLLSSTIVFAAGPGDVIESAVNSSKKETEEVKGHGVYAGPHKYYDYHPDYDKSHVYTPDEPNGAMGGGGGASGKGKYSNDSSGKSNTGKSNGTGKSAGSSGQNVVKTQEQINQELAKQAAAERALQESIQADLDKAKKRASELAESAARRAIQESMIAESIKKESIEESIKEKNREIEESRQNNNRSAVPIEKTLDETTYQKPNLDETIEKPTNNSIQESLVIPEIQTFQEIPIETITTIPAEEVTVEETYIETKATETIKNTVKQTETIKQTEKETVIEKETEDETIVEPVAKEGDKGDFDSSDEDASLKRQGGVNLRDGAGSGMGGNMTGIKVIEIERNGNIGFTEDPGLKNVKLLITRVLLPSLLLIGIIHFYLKQLISKIINKKKYII